MHLSRLALLLTVTLVLPVTAHAAPLDPLVPEDTQSYLSIQVRQILDAPVVKKHFLAPARDFLTREMAQIDGVLRQLGFDPFKHLDRVIIASPGGSDTDRGLIIVHGTFDPVKFKAKADTATREGELTTHKVPLGKGVTHPVYEVALGGEDEVLFLALVNNKTVIASPGKDYVVAALQAAAEKKKPILKNRDFQALVEKLDPKQSISLAILGKTLAEADGIDGLPKLVTDALAGVEVIGGGVMVGNEVKLDLFVTGKSERNATAVREALDRGVKLALVGLALVEEGKGVGLLLEVIKTVKVSGKGKMVGVSARLTADVLQDFFRKDE